MAKKDNEAKDLCRIVTPKFRVSYPHLAKANGIKGSAPKFSVTMLFPKDSNLKTLKNAIRNAKVAEFGEDEDNWPEDIASPVVDGDKPKYADKEGYKGCYAIKASSNEANKPGVVDEDGEEILNVVSDVYAGCYARAQVFARVWEFPEGSGRYGVHFILDHVQKLEDGKSFGGKKSAKQAFGITSGDDDEGDDFT